MLRKLLILIIVLALLVAGLQAFGGRDFSQIDLAMDKYKSDGELSVFVSDLGIIFKGGRVKESLFPNSRYNNMVYYRWVDELGEVHVSQRQPKVEKYEEIRLGDMQFQVEEGMSEEQIEAVLKLKGDK